MDFARKQLEKYGWKDGEGLGRGKQGINEALRPKIKRGSTGLGHNLADDHTDHWWQKLYDKASQNIEIEESSKSELKILTKDKDAFSKRNVVNGKSYKGAFIKKAVLDVGGANESSACGSSSGDEEQENGAAVVLTDEQLYAACGGMTAHKGARHGLKAEGKLSRIERQEAALLVLPQFKSYTNCKKKRNLETEENNEMNIQNPVIFCGNRNEKKSTKLIGKRKQETREVRQENDDWLVIAEHEHKIRKKKLKREFNE